MSLRPSVPTNPRAETKVELQSWEIDIDWMTEKALDLLRRISELKAEKRALIRALRIALSPTASEEEKDQAELVLDVAEGSHGDSVDG